MNREVGLMFIEEVKGFYSISPLKLFRKTEGVVFDLVPGSIVEASSSVDRVIHKHNAISPGSVEGEARPWYMHLHQKDNLVVLHGYRRVELYSLELKRKVVFEIHPDKLYRDGDLIISEGVVLSWDTKVFHRIVSGEEGSASINLAIRDMDFDIKTNFNIYSLDEESGQYKTVREGYKDQF